MTEAEQNPDHHLSISINNWQADDIFWEGKGFQQITAKYTTRSLIDRKK